MIRGHKGFERIVWAFKNVLNQSVTWLFCDLHSQTNGTGPVAALQPVVRTVEPQIDQLSGVETPHFPDTVKQDDHVQVTELLEWLNLMTVLSPRLQNDDSMDAYLSRYRVPNFSKQIGGPVTSTETVSRFRWRGFIPGTSTNKILLATLKACGNDWFAMSASSFDGHGYAILTLEHQTMTWEYLD